MNAIQTYLGNTLVLWSIHNCLLLIYEDKKATCMLHNCYYLLMFAYMAAISRVKNRGSVTRLSLPPFNSGFCIYIPF